MFLPDAEVRRCTDLVKAAFPRFNDWQYVNEPDASYSGFALWGEFVSEPDDLDSRHFFLTFDRYGNNWSGHLLIAAQRKLP